MFCANLKTATYCFASSTGNHEGMKHEKFRGFPFMHFSYFMSFIFFCAPPAGAVGGGICTSGGFGIACAGGRDCPTAHVEMNPLIPSATQNKKLVRIILPASLNYPGIIYQYEKSSAPISRD